MFHVPAAREPFEFEVDGEEFSLPRVDDLPIADALRIKARADAATGGRGDVLMAVALEFFDEHAPGVTGRLTMSQFGALANAWLESGDVGESSGSSD